MRNRLEDLGRLMVLLDNITKHPLFDGVYWSRPKEAEDWFFAQTKERQGDVIHAIAYGIEAVDHMVHEAWSIAAGTDDFNENTK